MKGTLEKGAFSYYKRTLIRSKKLTIELQDNPLNHSTKLKQRLQKMIVNILHGFLFKWST